VVADLEMEKGVVLNRTPVAADKGVRADEVDRARDVAAVAARHHEQYVVGHALADQREEPAVEVGAAPFARASFHIEGIEIVPNGFREIPAGEPIDLNVSNKCLAPLLAQGLPLAGGERCQEIFVGRISFVEEMELLVL